MAKDFVSMILQALKDNAGIDIPAESQQAAETALEGLPLSTSDKVLQEGQIAVFKQAWDSRGEDLHKFKEKARELADELGNLKDTIKAGDSTSAKLIDDLKTRIKQLEPLNEKLLAAAASRWENLAGTIPEAQKKAFAFAKEAEEGKDPEPLTPDQVVANLDKYDELSGLKVPGFGEAITDGKSTKPAVGAAKTTQGKEKGKDPDWKGKPAAEKIATGYETVTKLNADPPGQQDGSAE